MKNLRIIFNNLFGILFLMNMLIFQSCEKLNIMDPGEPYNPLTGVSTLEYFRTIHWDGDYEYDLFADLIEYSGVSLENKTLFAPADNNWETWMSDKGYTTITDIPVNEIRDIILNHLIEGKKTRLDLDLPDTNPQTLEGTDVPSDIETIFGNIIKVNVSYFGNTGRGLQMTVGTTSANKLIMVGDIENTDAVVHLYGFLNTQPSDKGLLLP